MNDSFFSAFPPGPESARVSCAFRKCLIGLSAFDEGLKALAEVDLLAAIADVMGLYTHGTVIDMELAALDGADDDDDEHDDDNDANDHGISESS